jgi:quercetin dioxygenase-like cupin family protein
MIVSEKKVLVAELNEVKAAEMKSGLLMRRTLAYNDQIMLCHFTMQKGLKLELHKHVATQIGYVIKGIRMRFMALIKSMNFQKL